MVQTPTGYVFLCSSDTEDECLERNLFGGTKKYQSNTKDVKPGDKLYLYNYREKRLHGTFEATSESALDIVPDAWGGKFPWQVRVKRVNEHVPLSKPDAEGVLIFKSSFPKPKLSEKECNRLERLFVSTQRIPTYENDFRISYPAKYMTNDGHIVRSLGELSIDNWLYHQLIAHGYERRVPIDEVMFCDFTIPIPDSKRVVYIEYWGMEDEKYLERKKKKIALYEKHSLLLISLDTHDLEALDDTLPARLRKYLPDKKFY